MRGKTVFFAALVVFLIIGLGKVFRTDTDNPESVVKSYLNNWQVDNSRSIYPLLSDRAKRELSRQKVHDASDYVLYFAENHKDLTQWSLRSWHLGEHTSRFQVVLKSKDILGQQQPEEAIIHLVKQGDGWRVDSVKRGRVYALP